MTEITKCTECGYEISISTSHCPGCGERIGIELGGIRGFLKRMLIIILVIYILLGALGII